MDQRMKKGLGFVLATALISGISIFINQFGVKGMDSSVFTFSKNVVVALLLASVLLASRVNLRSLSRKSWLHLAGIGFVGGSIPFLLFFRGLQMTSGTTAAFLHKTLFVYASLIALVFLKEKLNKTFVIGAALLLTGNFILLRPDSILSLGHLFILLATMLWAIESCWSRHVLKNISGSTVAFGRMFFGSLFLLAFLGASGKIGLVTTLSLTQIAWVLVTAVFLLAYVYTYYTGLKHVPVSTAVSVLALGMPVTTLLHWVYGSTAFSFVQALGIACIVAGSSLVIWMTTRIHQYPSVHHERH